MFCAMFLVMNLNVANYVFVREFKLLMQIFKNDDMRTFLFSMLDFWHVFRFEKLKVRSKQYIKVFALMQVLELVQLPDAIPSKKKCQNNFECQKFLKAIKFDFTQKCAIQFS
eukprot:TRINITY_DN5986_c0_g1_i3.p1 TRINITY_DN5986_c0_g1~~TRINITY_DN5986_c0_g1_i3.p1  ORF type:complete len:112 (-),score=2.68 TRINITY_DN5986_c0_g1_i3:274-609(-)